MLKILFVEDDEDLRDLIGTYLKNELAAEVKTLESGNLAISELQKDHNYDFIVSDYKMSDGTGGDLLEHMANMGLQTPVVLFSNSINLSLKKTPTNYLGLIGKLNLKQLQNLIIRYTS